MKAFVTGATGFVGSHVARLLAAQGADLRLLVRSTSRRENLEGLSADLVTGDLTDQDSLRRGMEGCDAVFHVAADYRFWVRDPQPMYATNVGGTEAVIRAAQQAGVPRTVYCSSVATLGFGYQRISVDEDTPVTEAGMIGHYKHSKYLAERKAVELAAAGAEVVIVNPSTPIGEMDIKPTPTGRIVLDFLRGNFPAYMETGMNLVDVHDVARGHLLAFEKGRRGERYILGGENVTLKQILDTLGEITGLPSPTMKVPHSVALAYAAFDQTFNGLLLHREPRATVEEVRMGKKYMWVSTAKAERELDYHPAPTRDALRRAAEWFVDKGYAADYRKAVAKA
ncbi:MAG: NAD-dependent epimerase/dehydratase family protein [Acidobacteriota bacterium]|nr:NAD-dependent epimerase/dehydratase family protein [Acidobacteriota bacterium]